MIDSFLQIEMRFDVTSRSFLKSRTPCQSKLIYVIVPCPEAGAAQA